MEKDTMKRLVLILIIAAACVSYGIRAVDTVKATVLQRNMVISEAFRK